VAVHDCLSSTAEQRIENPAETSEGSTGSEVVFDFELSAEVVGLSVTIHDGFSGTTEKRVENPAQATESTAFNQFVLAINFSSLNVVLFKVDGQCADLDSDASESSDGEGSSSDLDHDF